MSKGKLILDQVIEETCAPVLNLLMDPSVPSMGPFSWFSGLLCCICWVTLNLTWFGVRYLFWVVEDHGIITSPRCKCGVISTQTGRLNPETRALFKFRDGPLEIPGGWVTIPKKSPAREIFPKKKLCKKFTIQKKIVQAK